MSKLIYLLFLIFPFIVSAEDIYVSCTSASGKSIYDLALPSEDEKTGEIRLRFNDQDILYSAKVKIANTLQLVGVAKYKASRSGHQEAKSWVFTYKIETNTLIDDGRLTANCQ
jgi:hypothetical protein|tara:strand:- start:89 stop:427 length:339 start_codon:yes stop_codon:yes gene_type:complete